MYILEQQQDFTKHFQSFLLRYMEATNKEEGHFKVQKNLHKFSRFLRQEGRLRSLTWIRFDGLSMRIRADPEPVSTTLLLQERMGWESSWFALDVMVTLALSDCTSQMLSNCATRSPGFTNHSYKNKKSFNQSLNQLIKANLNWFYFIKNWKHNEKITGLRN